MTSFSAEAKNEICKNKIDERGIISELAALTFACGSLTVCSGKKRIIYTTENKSAAKHIRTIISDILKLDTDVEIKESSLKKKNIYTVRADDGELLLSVLGLNIKDLLNGTMPKYIYKGEEDKTALLRGAFLGSGSLSNPKKNYHFEFVTQKEPFADILISVLKHFNIKAKKIIRKDSYVIYLNEGDGISALLAKIGAHASILNFENIRALKEMRNNVNRAVNCETANINKTVNAALIQRNNIRLIESSLGFKKLSAALKEACELRLEHPNASLSELSEISGISKSALNHRLRKINAIANSLKREEAQ